MSEYVLIIFVRWSDGNGVVSYKTSQKLLQLFLNTLEGRS